LEQPALLCGAEAREGQLYASGNRGPTRVEATIANPRASRRTARMRFPVDSGVVCSVVPARVLRKLGVEPHSRRTFALAGGDVQRPLRPRAVGDEVGVIAEMHRHL